MNYAFSLLILLPFALLSTGCSTTSAPLATVKAVDIDAYAGKWYEIARLPNRFERGLTCVTATYTPLDNGKIEVRNAGYNAAKGRFKDIKGRAWQPNAAELPGQLKVSFFGPFAGDYYIMQLADDYSHALVGSPTRDYLWVLSRTPTLDEATYDRLLAFAESRGFDTAAVERIDQTCEGIR